MTETVQPPANDNAAQAPKCMICGKPQMQRFKPFCSKHCADVDLNRWLKGNYAIPVVEDDISSEGEG
ncbi:MAG: DNA gyrase inhibitor YacG [Beijerinckiaceae bacterium]